MVTFFPSLLSVFCQLTISDSWERQHGQHKMKWICVTHKTPFFIFVQTTILVLQLNQVIRVGVIQRGWSRRIFVFVPNNLQKNRYPNHALISQCYQNFSQSTTTTTRTTTTTIRAAATAITTNILQKKPGQRHSRRSPPQLIIEVTSHCGVHMIFVLGGAAGGREAFKSILFSAFY